MSGDSPSALTQDNVFIFKEGRSSPTPTTSKNDIIPLHSTPATDSSSLVTASVIVEPTKDKEKNDNEKENDIPLSDLNSPILNNCNDNNSRRNSDNDKTLKLNEEQSNDNKNSLSFNCGNDKLDGKTDIKDKSDEEDQEDDSCIVNCLYYTMQCCECTIM